MWCRAESILSTGSKPGRILNFACPGSVLSIPYSHRLWLSGKWASRQYIDNNYDSNVGIRKTTTTTFRVDAHIRSFPGRQEFVS